MNADIPRIECFLRAEFAYDLQGPHEGEYIPCVIFGIASIESRAIGWHCMTNRGAQIGRLPLHAFCWRECDGLGLEVIELWDCFSYRPDVHRYEYLAERQCRVHLRDGQVHRGSYLFTVDWYGNRYSEDAGDLGWKCAHILKLDDGNFAAQPNNRILWYDQAMIAEPYPEGEKPDYVLNTHTYSVEGKSRYTTENSDAMFYADAKTH